MTNQILKTLVFAVLLFNYSVGTAQDIALDWAKGMGGTDYDYGKSITTDASGNVYTTGYFQGTANFDPSGGTYNLTSAGDYDIFIQKIDASGNLVWAKKMGGASADKGISLSIDAFGNVYTTGCFAETADFDPSTGTYNLTSAGSYDIFIQKLDADGNFVWAKAMGGTYADLGKSITTDASGNVYTTGYFYGTADFDPSGDTYNLTSAGQSDIFIQKLDADGNFVWAKRMGGASYDYGFSITTDASGNVYTTGYFEGTADFEPSAGTSNLTSAGGGNIFVAKYAQTNVGISDWSASSISIYPNPVNDKLSIVNNQLAIKNVEITDLAGKTMVSRQISDNNSNIEIDLSDLNHGMYVVLIRTDKELFTAKIVKE